MKFKIGDYVLYEGRKWEVYGLFQSESGEVTYYLKRGVYRTTAKEKELMNDGNL